MNTLYDRGVVELIQSLVSDNVSVIYSQADYALIETSKKSGKVELPLVVVTRQSGFRMYVNEAHHYQQDYQGTNFFKVPDIIPNKKYLDTMGFQAHIPYKITIYTTRLSDAYEFAEELIIKIKMYPAVKIKLLVDIPYVDDNGATQRYRSKLPFECAIDLEGGGSGVSVEDGSDLVDNFNATGSIYTVTFEFTLNCMIIRFKVNGRIVEFQNTITTTDDNDQ